MACCCPASSRASSVLHGLGVGLRGGQLRRSADASCRSMVRCSRWARATSEARPCLRCRIERALLGVEAPPDQVVVVLEAGRLCRRAPTWCRCCRWSDRVLGRVDGSVLVTVVDDSVGGGASWSWSSAWSALATGASTSRAASGPRPWPRRGRPSSWPRLSFILTSFLRRTEPRTSTPFDPADDSSRRDPRDRLPYAAPDAST